MKKLILIFSVTALLVNFGCKKRSTTPVNPDVNSSLLDSTVITPTASSSKQASIDVNKDGSSDFRISATNDNGSLSTILLADRSFTPIEFVIDDTEIGYAFGENALIDSTVIVPKPPKPHLQFGREAITSYKSVAANLGHAGTGDFFVAFKIVIDDENHYGWLKLNVSADGTTLKLRSLGYNIKPEASLKAGEY